MEVHELLEIGSLMSIPNFILSCISFDFNGLSFFTDAVYAIFAPFSRGDCFSCKNRLTVS